MNAGNGKNGEWIVKKHTSEWMWSGEDVVRGPLLHKKGIKVPSLFN